MTVYADLVRYRELFANLFRRDLQAKYKGSLLGVAWSLVNPLVLLGIYLLVFSLLWPVVEIEHYGLYLLAGLALWIFFATSLQAASRSLVENASLIRKVRFPRQLVPLAMVATQLVSFVVMLALVVCLVLVFRPEARDTVWLALPLSIPYVGLVAGVALAVAAANALYRDVEHVVGALLLPWFFLTPVLYRLEDLPSDLEQYRGLAEALRWANFMTPSIDALRDPLFFGRLPRAWDVVYLCAAALVALALGAYVFSRVDDRIPVEL